MVEHKTSEKINIHYGVFYKKKKRKKEIYPIQIRRMRQLISPESWSLKSLEEVCPDKFSPSLIEKIIATRATKKRTKDKKWEIAWWSRQPEAGWKHPQEDNGVVRSWEFALESEAEMPATLGKQEVTNISITIRKGGEQIQTNTYILTFNQFHILKEEKVEYYLEKVEQYVPVPRRCFKCQKYGHHWEACRGRQICKVWRKGSGPHGGRLLKGNQISKMPTKPTNLLKIL